MLNNSGRHDLQPLRDSSGRSLGFTLLEMLLTLAMSVVLMILVSGAINFYARDMENAEEEFRQVQLAASVLQMIEDDLRSTMVTRPVETDALAEILSSAAAPLEALGLASPAAGDNEDSLASLPPNESEADLSSDLETMDMMTSANVLMAPGLIGNETQLQVDVSRLPNLESYAIDPTMIAPDSNGGLTDRASDLKTIAYFVIPEGGVGPTDALASLATSTQSDGGGGGGGGGLVRRQLDRAISNQAAETGGLTQLLASGDIIAPEVTSILFEYYDGINWLPQYSSDDLGYLPMAIRVTLTMSEAPSTTVSDTEARTFTHLIYLPFSHPEDGEELLEEMEEGTTDATI